MARVMETALDVMDRPWDWGQADCCTSACDVFYRLYGIDPMESLRGKYATEFGAMRLIAKHGGFLRMAATLADRTGLVACEPKAGAIGVSEKALVICVKPNVWLGKTLHGLGPVSEVIEAYHVEA